MNLADRVIAYFSPVAGLQRHAARRLLASYEGAEPGRLRKFARPGGTPDQMTQRAAMPLREQARHLERNHDIARGALRTLVNNVVGPKGIGIEPQPRRADGSIHQEYAKALLEQWRDWQRKPEVTQRHTWSRVQRLMCKAWVRDGESFAQRLIGTVPYLDHGTRVPLSLELFEADMVPYDYSDGARIQQGIERNAWGKPVRYFVYRTAPGDLARLPGPADVKALPYDAVYQIASIDRIHQMRGISEFASVITRLEDIKDYEESERVAAKIAAMLTAYVKKGTPDLYAPTGTPEDPSKPREIKFAPGMVIDDLAVGEEIGLVDSKRPNPNLLPFRQGQLRAIAAGLGASYSSVSRDYNGTYSAQRQELVEQWVHYASLSDEFVGQFVQPVWEDFVLACTLSGVVPVPSDVVAGSENDAVYVAQAMPWIDPLKEALGATALIEQGLASEIEMIRRRGATPGDVIEQIAAYRSAAAERGLAFGAAVARSAPDGGKEPDAGNADPEAAAA
ncbi:phage portal protein [Niveibacterium sp. SC-1]|uniref:phage portal protein n=1 Tax=Niveibacterium sp. SC-1 TaxID=3135646 RepID=UPI00311EFBA1